MGNWANLTLFYFAVITAATNTYTCKHLCYFWTHFPLLNSLNSLKSPHSPLPTPYSPLPTPYSLLPNFLYLWSRRFIWGGFSIAVI
ncbi:MAG: hypothetical protein KME64_02215 [Scytonematopsis contorta HA4267-MV1]|nr:hypothetical protein [Scytonematopsis contorta HA4267-MV1]